MLASFKSWAAPDRKPDPPAPLLSTWAVQAAAGEPFATVRVQNLQATTPFGRDAWGRANKPQPALISTEVSFLQPFGTAAADDRVSADTAHYGNLSKNLLASLELFRTSAAAAAPKSAKALDAAGGGGGGPSSADAFELLWVGLTGRVVDGSRMALPMDRVPFLDASKLRALSLTLHLPKASLLGSGVSLSVASCFHAKEDVEGNPVKSYARSLRIHGLRIPTLVGVNGNERQAKQMVVVDVTVEKLVVTRDIHPELERLIVETVEASSFETLEALGAHLAEKILGEFKVGDDPKSARDRGWQVKIVMEKPIAVPFADCPAVEIKAGAGFT